jgi:hypothetical protein
MTAKTKPIVLIDFFIKNSKNVEIVILQNANEVSIKKWLKKWFDNQMVWVDPLFKALLKETYGSAPLKFDFCSPVSRSVASAQKFQASAWSACRG